jgi:hypothetical protein
MRGLQARLAVMLEEADHARLAASILGSASAATIAADLDALCRDALGAGIQDGLGCAMSVGAVFELALADGREVAIKVHAPGADAAGLSAAYRVMDALAQAGLPCPRLLAAPRALGAGLAVIMTRLPSPAEPPLAPEQRRAFMARGLASLVEHATSVDRPPALPGARVFASPWPAPHSVLFDFEGSRAGAEWIDAIGAETASRLARDRGAVVIGHSDWSAHNVRCTERGIAAIYDCDGLRLDGETVFAGNAAITACLDARPGRPFHPPAPEQAIAFLCEYERARARSFSAEERSLIAASAVRQLGYLARCQHALRTRAGDPKQGPMEQMLPRFAPWLDTPPVW